MSEMPVISADSHIQEPPELYTEWLDKKFRDRAPRREVRDGKTYVIVDGFVLARFVNERDWTDPAMVEYFQRLLETLR